MLVLLVMVVVVLVIVVVGVPGKLVLPIVVIVVVVKVVSEKIICLLMNTHIFNLLSKEMMNPQIYLRAKLVCWTTPKGYSFRSISYLERNSPKHGKCETG